MKTTPELVLYKKLIPTISIFVSYDLNTWEKFDDTYSNTQEILASIILYSDGQIIDGHHEFEPLPKGAYFIEERADIDRTRLPKFKDMVSEIKNVEITHSSTPFNSYDSGLYATRIKNKGSVAFKVNRFSSYTKQRWNVLKTRPEHANIINGWFNDNDFRMWYGQNSEWINPQETFCDYRNYGDHCFWLYEIQTKDGQVFWISSYKE
jgi:hypothetical protein